MAPNDQQNTSQTPPRDPRREINERGSMHAKPLPSSPFSILNLEDFIETVDVAPTAAPKTFYDSIKIVVDDLASPTTYELYIYSRKLAAWLKATLATA